ncbi:MAG: thymidylate synthase [Candidatus Parcubacteria bacterium]|nr:FAD-dependent thymidylate synthase [Patescibacteria group bacterium]BCX16011.1 MAG: thymidylate synthase [Candidatus Parcubacteria bacterium]
MEEILFEKPILSEEERYLIEPFFTNLDRSVYGVTFLPPEIVGALSSRASRTKDDLRVVFLNEFIKPFLETDYGNSFQEFAHFLHQNSFEKIFANPKAREFYFKWLSEYGDDSIAQMAGTHLVFSSLSQLAIKHFENQRIGLAPIEKSTRYVDFSRKINNSYRYFTPPEIEKFGLKQDYKKTLDFLFETYSFLSQSYLDFLKNKFPNEKELVLKTKAFDVARLILPVATLGQVAFFGNGQAFEYLISRSLESNLEEVRWAAQRAYEELFKVIPAFLRRLDKEESKSYRKYLGERKSRVKEVFKEIPFPSEEKIFQEDSKVRLLEYDPLGEDKVIAGILYSESGMNFSQLLEKVKKLTLEQKERVLAKILSDRKFRWYKVPRAFENVYLRFEIETNIGAWRDLQRHRMQTQQHQRFTISNGFDVPQELREARLENSFLEAIKEAENLFEKVRKIDEEVAQYVVSFAHRVRFIQYQNLRQFFWETELRTTPQGHPDYRKVEQEKVKLVQKIYPLISKYLLVSFEDYDLPRRQTPEEILKREKELKEGSA